MTAPLRRNRDFVLLQAGQLLSAAGSRLTSVAYPLLVLAITHSPAKAGIVGFARELPYGAFGLLAGVAADRWNRKRIMIAADGMRAVTMAAFGLALFSHHVPFWTIPLVALIEGTGSVFFDVAQTGALRSVVPSQQLPDAVGVQQARQAAVSLAGPPLGGALFAIGRSLPFVTDAASYAFSFLSLTAMRTPFQEERERTGVRVRTMIAEGFDFLWHQPFIRTTTFLYALGNVAIPGVLLTIVVVARREHLSSAAIGGLLSIFAACSLAGALASPVVRARASMRAIILVEGWAWLGVAAFLVRASVMVLVIGIAPLAFALPVTDSVVVGYRVAVTPDRLLGRVESVRSNMSRLVAPLGPLSAGLLLTYTSARTTVAIFGVLGLVLAVWSTLSTAVRNAPGLGEIDGG